ncbi:MAG: DUF1993 domain-containing protein [Burkholderiales bacterium]|nr:DUF1993 domain-containing protein [Burkholderiales bacterium]
MTISMYKASVPVFQQILGSMDAILAKAQIHINERKIDQQAFLQARLFPDMFHFTRQVQIACDFAKGCTARLAGQEVPSYEDNENSIEELRARIAKTLAFIASVPAAAIDGSEERDIHVGSGDKARQFKGQQYLLNYALPHFYFHATTTYALLRHNGVAVGKKDFIGNIS